MAQLIADPDAPKGAPVLALGADERLTLADVDDAQIAPWGWMT